MILTISLPLVYYICSKHHITLDNYIIYLNTVKPRSPKLFKVEKKFLVIENSIYKEFELLRF